MFRNFCQFRIYGTRCFVNGFYYCSSRTYPYKLLDDEKRYLEQDVENLLQMPPPERYELTI